MCRPVPFSRSLQTMLGCLAALCSFPCLASDVIYKCDNNGKTVYSDQLCANAIPLRIDPAMNLVQMPQPQPSVRSVAQRPRVFVIPDWRQRPDWQLSATPAYRQDPPPLDLGGFWGPGNIFFHFPHLARPAHPVRRQHP